MKTQQLKDHKLIQLLETQQQRGQTIVNNVTKLATSNSANTTTTSNVVGQGKVRQMFEERRAGKKGLDRSTPLEPLKSPRSSPSPSTIQRQWTPNTATPTPSPSPIIQQRQWTPSPTPPPPPNVGSSKKPAPNNVVQQLKPISSKSKTFENSTANTNGFTSNAESMIDLPIKLARSQTFIKKTNSMDELIPRSTKYSDYIEEFEQTVRDKEDELKIKLNLLNLVDDSNDVVVVNERPRPSSLVIEPSTKAILPPPPGTVPCKYCSRTFTFDRISKHESVCVKTKNTNLKKKIGQTQATQARKDGHGGPGKVKKPTTTTTAQAKRQQPASTNSSAAPSNPTQPNWRRKHEDFLNTIRYAKKVNQQIAAGLNPNDIEPPPETDYSDLIKCKYCSRKFNARSLERHEAICENIKSNK